MDRLAKVTPALPVPPLGIRIAVLDWNLGGVDVAPGLQHSFVLSQLSRHNVAAQDRIATNHFRVVLLAQRLLGGISLFVLLWRNHLRRPEESPLDHGEVSHGGATEGGEPPKTSRKHHVRVRNGAIVVAVRTWAKTVGAGT